MKADRAPWFRPVGITPPGGWRYTDRDYSPPAVAARALSGCPLCGAPVDALCVTRSGKPTSEHSIRMQPYRDRLRADYLDRQHAVAVKADETPRPDVLALVRQEQEAAYNATIWHQITHGAQACTGTPCQWCRP